MTRELWNTVDSYICDALNACDDVLDLAQREAADAGLPNISVSANQGKLLNLIARMMNARNILEIGTLGGFSAIWMARALPPGGRLISLEIEQQCADVARKNIERAGLSKLVDIRVAPAIETLPKLVKEVEAPFDLVFIDADKKSIPEYFEWALKMSRVGTMIVVDNVVRGGTVIDPDSDDPGVHGIRRVNELIAREPRVSATAIQTVGSKGYDGLLFALVVA
ncbi:MAG: O-methyltransferase [Planctomycetes bacterium]|nr:O-methyltransferase [Planctomycetota bacterium]